MKKLIKQTMLLYGGYKRARKIHAKIEHHNLVQRYLKFLDTGQAPLPDRVMFEPTQRCNLQCKMCFQDRSKIVTPEELTLKEISDFFNSKAFFKKATLIGGEVYMRRDINDLVKCLNRTLDLVICTNGTLLGEAEFKVISDCKRLFTVCISLDGTRDIHDSIRQVKGSYDKAIRTIKALVNIVPVTVNLVIQDENIHVIPETIELCISLGVKKVKIEMERIYSCERQEFAASEMGLLFSEIPLSDKNRKRGYSFADLQCVLIESLERGRKSAVDVFIDPPYLADNLEECYENSILNKQRFVCHLMNTATITPNGNVINCIHIRKNFGNILETPFEEIWQSDKANEFRQQLLQNNLTPLCENCPFMIPAPEAFIRKIAS